MIVQVELELLGDLPQGVQVGDQLDIAGRITVRSVDAELIDVSTMTQKAWALGSTNRVVAFANRVKFREVVR